MENPFDTTNSGNKTLDNLEFHKEQAEKTSNMLNPVENVDSFKKNSSKENKLRKVEEKDRKIMDILKIFAPGTSLRTALDLILGAELGALIVVDKEGLSEAMEGGFRVNCKFSSQRLVELSKMDGAIILSSDLKKILYSNVLIVPNRNILSNETGTRHKAAERISKQLGTLTIAVSERQHKITIYYGDVNFVLEKSSEILAKVADTIQVLEKQRELFNELLINLNVLEITNLVSMSDVAVVMQRVEIVQRISERVKKLLVQLGKEGVLGSMRLKELTKDLSKERELLLNDYFRANSQGVSEMLKKMDFDFLLETPNILRMIFGELHDGPISPRGIRILSKANLLEKDAETLMNNFKTIDKVFDAEREDLMNLFHNESFVISLKKSLNDIRNKIMVGKKI